MTVGESVRDDLYDEKVDEEAEEKMLEKYKQERLEEMFPDEVDTPRDVAARIRLVNESKINVFTYTLCGSELYQCDAKKEKCIVSAPEELTFYTGSSNILSSSRPCGIDCYST